jgi:hypothetical protein
MILEQIHIPFAPELAASVDISNHIAESGIGNWIGKNWKVLIALFVFILFIVFIKGGFDKKSAIEEAPQPITPPSPQPTVFPHIQTPRT